MAKKLSKSIQERRKKRLNTVPLVSRNRFEVHLNRSKHNILGKKEKHDRGAPGVSRSKANEKRKKTLLVKYKQRNKSNVMIDKRFGEFDETVSVEEKMLKRFTLEKQSHHVKAGHYNIEDDEELTHYGQNLAEITNFNELELGLSDDENGEGDLYGGFLTKKKKVSDGTWEEESGGRKMTQKEILQEMIVDSKRDKHERQKTKELSFELTQRLDKEWKDVHSMLIKRSNQLTSSKKEKQDDYDKIVNELVFEAKGRPTERLKSVEEIARKEKNREMQMEKQRIGRMELVDEDEDLIHQSADALIEKLPKKVDSRYMLQYKDGQMVMPEGADDSMLPQGEDMQNDGIDKNGDGDDSGDDEDGGEESDGDPAENEGEEDSDIDNEDTDNEDVFSDEEAQVDDSYTDVKKTKQIEEQDKFDEVKPDVDMEKGKIIKKDKRKSSQLDTGVKAPKEEGKKTKKKQNDITGDKYDYHVPENLENLLHIQSTESDISILFSKIRRVNIGNKKKLEKLLDILFQYIDHLCEQFEPEMRNINILGVVIQELAQDLPVYITKVIQLKLKAMLKRITTCLKQKCYSEILPSLREFMLLKIIEFVFPTSDLSHMITTPTLFIISLILVKVRFTDMKSVVCGVFLLDTVYNYVKLSKRYLPELILFLTRILYEAVHVSSPLNKITSSVLNMQRHKSGMLYISENQNVELCSVNISLLSSSCTISSVENASIKLSIIRNMLMLSEKFCKLYSEMETFKEIFEPILAIVDQLPVDNYPSSIKALHSKLVGLIQSKSNSEKVPLKLQTRKPIPLTLLEPQFEEVNDNLFKKRTGDKAKNEHDKLKYKVKRELKGALKEIRKDSHYLAKQQLGEQLEKDANRKRKVKELKSALENERREIREMEKGSKVRK